MKVKPEIKECIKCGGDTAGTDYDGNIVLPVCCSCKRIEEEVLQGNSFSKESAMQALGSSLTAII